ncbi:Uu.00g145010.m01.CDS01 [Anthostomella pinea]|uniref:Delta(24)-sterol reductase n=1 Tax=Anthostomella pinea TaxID=933095 RepID=A0AAI8VKG9_9PEZI|nr:Uu.00g145010.m01.CDS01 [Anthostomella pinea]
MLASPIAKTVRSFYDRGESFRIFRGSTNSTRPPHHEKTVDISALSNIIHINQDAHTILVEPNVPMDRLVAATLQHNLIPPVVMEFPGITAGGGYAASAGESSSFKHGYFDQTANWVEMILGNGDIIKASPTENSDLFQGAAGALGTLGIMTLIELRLIPAKKYVCTTYHRTGSVAETIETIQRETQDAGNDYIDGIIFSKTHGVVITGRMTDSLPSTTKPQTFSRAWDPWYYLHLQSKTAPLNPAGTTSDYVPLPEYLFRWDRGGFWVGREAFSYFGPIPFNRYTRWFLDDFMHTRMLYRALHSGSGSERSAFGVMVQDLALPYATAEAFIDYTATELDIWPLWLCPLRGVQGATFHPSTTLAEPMLNIGLWGRASRDWNTFVCHNRRLEKVLGTLGGRKVLYSHTYYTEEEFWALYD